MNDPFKKQAPEQRKDNAGEMDGDSWGPSGSTGAPVQDEAGQRGDNRTHDWEVGDRTYTGTEAQRGQGKDRSFTGATPDKAKANIGPHNDDNRKPTAPRKRSDPLSVP